MSPIIVLVMIIGGLTAILVSWSAGGTMTLPSIAVIAGSLGYLAWKAEAARRHLEELHTLRAAYAQVDQQTKLILRTDLELHRAQEELDRRLASLMSLYELGRQLEVNLRPDEIYAKLAASLVTNFGFAKGLLGLSGSFEELEWRSLIGVTPQDGERLRAHLVNSHLLKQVMVQPAAKLYTAAADQPPVRALLELLGVSTVVIASITPHTGPAGCLLLGRVGGSSASAKADEELVEILANQLESAVENSAQFEATFLAQRQLEQKVQQRTHELAEANARLQMLNKAKSDFVSAVSHELRTPLAAVKGYAALLRGGQFGPLLPAQMERLTKIERHSDLLTKLITDLLDIARIESGRVTMERKPIPVEELLATVQDMVRPQMEAKQLRYQVDRDGVTELIGDPQHLPRVFMNLLSNAIKYTPEHGSIRLSFTREEGTVVARVIDSGCGIPAEDLPKLFQEFYRANDPVNQQVRGTGLGLALVKRIVEAHHGVITVASEKDRGSTFTVRLPLEAPA